MALIPQEPKQRNAVLVGLVVVAAFYAFNSLWWGPKKEEIAQLDERYETLEGQNRRAEILATRGADDLVDRLALYERHIAELERLIPRRQEVPALIADVTRAAIRTDVEVSDFRPAGEELGAFYTKSSYEFQVIGDYHNVGDYLASIASLPRIVTPVDLELSEFRGAEVVAADMESPVLARFRIETYVLPDGMQAPPSAAPTDLGPEFPTGGDR
jgi:type IV pilus assembly protein PilO